VGIGTLTYWYWLADCWPGQMMVTHVNLLLRLSSGHKTAPLPVYRFQVNLTWISPCWSERLFIGSLARLLITRLLRVTSQRCGDEVMQILGGKSPIIMLAGPSCHSVVVDRHHVLHRLMIQWVQLVETLPMFYTPAHFFLVSCTFPVYRALSPMAFISLGRIRVSPCWRSWTFSLRRGLVTWGVVGIGTLTYWYWLTGCWLCDLFVGTVLW